jgi:hypothetical protein
MKTTNRKDQLMYYFGSTGIKLTEPIINDGHHLYENVGGDGGDGERYERKETKLLDENHGINRVSLSYSVMLLAYVLEVGSVI